MVFFIGNGDVGVITSRKKRKNNEQQKKHNDRPIPDYFSNDMEASKHMGAIGCLRTFDKEISTYRALRVTRARFWGGSFE